MFTTVIELLAFALLILAAALFVGQWSVPGALGTAGGLVLVVSVIIERPWRKKK